VSPILGIWASQNYPRITNSYESIATTTVGAGGTSTITFSSIPNTYKHLQIRYSGHLVGNANDYASLWMQFNSDTTANYSYHRLYGNGSSASADAATSQTRALTTWIPDNLTQSLSYGASVIDIFDYTNTNKYKTIRGFNGVDLNGTGTSALYSSSWRNTAAVTSITLSPAQDSWAQYTQFALYGVKSA